MGRFAFSLAVLSALLLIGCTTEPPTRADRDALQDDVASALKRMYVEDPGLQPFLAHARGYALFPAVGKGGLIAGGAYGRGQVFEQAQFVGYADMSQATIGLQAGGQSFNEVIAFQTADALNQFKSGQLTFAANASAVALKAGGAASASYANGVAVFVQPEGGLMLEAAIGGQSFSYQPK